MDVVLRISSNLVLEARSTTRLSADPLQGYLEVLQISFDLLQGANLTLHYVTTHDLTFTFSKATEVPNPSRLWQSYQDKIVLADPQTPRLI